MDEGERSPIVHVGPIPNNGTKTMLRYQLYPELERALLGVPDESIKPKQFTDSLSARMMLKITHRHHWTGAFDSKDPLYTVAHLKEWEYDDEQDYIEYFRNLRMGEATNMSLAEFLDMDYAHAINLLGKELERAKKEIKEEQDRKDKQKQREKQKETRDRIRRRTR